MEAFDKIITGDEKMLAIFKYINSIAKTNFPVMITGETGVGKELIAESVHYASSRKGDFVSVNVAGLDDNHFSDTLFGHNKGAFTGADKNRKGLVEKASGGTLFLDEIGDLCETSQIKLLRLIQEREFYTLGSDNPNKSQARIITATNHDIQSLQQPGKLRKDLFYRLNLHHIHIPSLKKRPGDIEIIGKYFIKQTAREFNVPEPEIPDDFFKLLSNYHFPGNVRELQALILDNISSPEFGKLSLDCLFEFLKINNKNSENITEKQFNFLDSAPISETELPSLKSVEEKLINKTLDTTQGNLSKSARILGISRVTLYRKLKKENRCFAG